ncbi:cyclic nucleotide-binding domain (cNMP-BD) protein [Rhodopirellula maiorica SM1]|uniref:Cyclic nucleotide-binding domain (cNMP-BD) protein n=1 Tax=Rhodopirellula maiorica SM1 TaxID=1265738 RepID=M5RRB4_9BACT|nr:cyclic nucleotide-binding domain-containing protein [Rhodopirellula maiorica]EMI16509.1 cyclic nucleotide-binding domain (cNMP-BD) protein [Rhodopirellula maiorica SM1]
MSHDQLDKEGSLFSVEPLAELASLQTYPAQQLLFREGEVHARIYWIKEGRVRLEMSGTRAGAKAMLTAGPGDLLGWSALLGDQRMTATAVATLETTLISFDAVALLQLCEQNHDIGYKVMHTIARSLSKRLVATRLQLLDLFHQPQGTTA